MPLHIFMAGRLFALGMGAQLPKQDLEIVTTGRKIKFMRLILLSLVIILGGGVNALAVQVHGAPEGYYTHNLAHVILIVAILFLLFWLRKEDGENKKAWWYFRLSLLFFLLWNLDAMTAHILKKRLPSEAFYLPPKLFDHLLLGPLDWERWVFYMTRFDHLLCVPAMFFLMQSLRYFYKTQNKQKSIS